MIQAGTTFSSVDGVGSDALQLSNQVYNFVGPALSDKQWKVEVEGWMETSLARWQAETARFAFNTDQPGPDLRVTFPRTHDDLQAEWIRQCSNQKTSSLGNYQNLSVFGLAFTWTILH